MLLLQDFSGPERNIFFKQAPACPNLSLPSHSCRGDSLLLLSEGVSLKGGINRERSTEIERKIKRKGLERSRNGYRRAKMIIKRGMKNTLKDFPSSSFLAIGDF